MVSNLSCSVSLNVTAKRLEKPVYECRARNAAMRLPLVERIELDVLCKYCNIPVVPIVVFTSGIGTILNMSTKPLYY